MEKIVNVDKIVSEKGSIILDFLKDISHDIIDWIKHDFYLAMIQFITMIFSLFTLFQNKVHSVKIGSYDTEEFMAFLAPIIIGSSFAAFFIMNRKKSLQNRFVTFLGGIVFCAFMVDFLFYFDFLKNNKTGTYFAAGLMGYKIIEMIMSTITIVSSEGPREIYTTVLNFLKNKLNNTNNKTE